MDPARRVVGDEGDGRGRRDGGSGRRRAGDDLIDGGRVGDAGQVHRPIERGVGGERRHGLHLIGRRAGGGFRALSWIRSDGGIVTPMSSSVMLLPLSDAPRMCSPSVVAPSTLVGRLHRIALRIELNAGVVADGSRLAVPGGAPGVSDGRITCQVCAHAGNGNRQALRAAGGG